MKKLPPGQWQSFTVQYPSRVRVLTTPIKVGLAFDPIDPKQSRPVDEAIDLTAVWDTGATGTVITKPIAKRLDLKPIRLGRGSTVGGEFESNVYLVSLFLPNRVCVPQVEAVEGKIRGADVLIGMDVIRSGDFAVTNFEDKTTLTFRIPSVERIDFGQARATPDGRSDPKPGRNQPCPCGSGRKYKYCCGK